MYLTDNAGVSTSAELNMVLLYLLGSTSVAEPPAVVEQVLASTLEVGSF